MHWRTLGQLVDSTVRTKYMAPVRINSIVYRSFSVLAKDSRSSEDSILPSELAVKYVQSLMKRSAVKVETDKLRNDFFPMQLSDCERKEDESDTRLVSQVRALFSKEHVDLNPWGSLTTRYQELFCQQVASLLAHQMNKLFLEPRARLVQNFMQDFAWSEWEVLERLKHMKEWTKETSNFSECNFLQEADASLTGEQVEEDSPHSALDMNSDPLLVARQMMTSPLFKILWKVLNSHEGFMALLFLRGTLSLNRNA